MALELLSQLCLFENSTKCSKISFDSNSFQNSQKGDFPSLNGKQFTNSKRA